MKLRKILFGGLVANGIFQFEVTEKSKKIFLKENYQSLYSLRELPLVSPATCWNKMSIPPEMSKHTLAKIIRSKSDNNTHGNGSYNDGGGSNQDDEYHKLCFNVSDFQILARKKLRKDIYEYLASGSDDEQTLAENRLGFRRWYLRPRVLRPIGRISTRTILRFGRPGSHNGYCECANGLLADELHRTVHCKF